MEKALGWDLEALVLVLSIPPTYYIFLDLGLFDFCVSQLIFLENGSESK